MTRVVQKHAPLLIAVTTLWASIVLLLMVSLLHNSGHFVYVLDDPYIHMAMAKHMVVSGVWGTTPYAFSSSTSSPLWTMLLSGLYALTGIHEILPFILNIVLATYLLVVAYRVLWMYQLAPSYLSAALVSIIFLTSLPALIFAGLEHVLQILLTVSFAMLCAQEVSNTSKPSSHVIALLFLALCLVATRYEGLILIAVGCLLLALQHRWTYAISLGLLGLAPVALYAAISVAHHSLWLPNSVLLKANLPPGGTERTTLFLARAIVGIKQAPHIISLLLVALLVYVRRRCQGRASWEYSQVLIVLFLVTASIQLPLISRVGVFSRYYAALIALGLLALAGPIYELLPARSSAITRNNLLACVMFAPVLALLISSAPGLWRIPRATTTIYEQQYQMGAFLKQFYNHSGVAANDVGIIDYRADLHLLDLWGLASAEVAKAKLTGTFNTTMIAELTASQHVRVAVVYAHWFTLHGYGGAELPRQWIKVGEWTISHNVLAGETTVSFYAVDTAEVPHLISSLRQFATQLPQTVQQSGRYTQNAMSRN